jgi:protease I
MKKMLIFIHNGFEDSEFIYPYYRFQEEGYKMDIVAPAKQEYTGEHGVSFTSDLSPEQVNLDEYSAIIIPGGKAPDRMRMNQGLVNIVKEAYKRGIVIAAVCHGPQMLIEADIVRGKTVTSWPSVRTDLKNAGARVVDESAAVDSNLVTSRSPKDLPDFCKATVKLLEITKRIPKKLKSSSNDQQK